MVTRASKTLVTWPLQWRDVWHGVWRWLLLPLASLGALEALAMAQADPAEAAETHFLALMIAGCLAVIGGLAPRRTPWPEALALAVTTLMWVLHGPQRGSVIFLLMLGGGVAAWRQTTARGLGRFVPAAYLVQLLLRPDLLLPPYLEARTIVSLWLLPAVVGTALAYLARRGQGPQAALLAGLVTVILAPGWNVTVTAALLAVAAGVAVTDRDEIALVRLLAVAALVAVALWQPPLGCVFVLTPLLVRLHRLRYTLAIAAALLALLALMAYGSFAVSGEALRWASESSLLHLLLILPFAALGARRRFLGLLVAGIAAGVFDGDPETLTAAMALMALAVPAPLLRVQTHVAIGWLLVAGGVGAYPWLRSEPTASVMQALGQHMSMVTWSVSAVVFAVVLAVLAYGRISRPPAILWAAIFVAVLAAARPAPVVVLDHVLLLTQDSAPWELALKGRQRQAITEVIVDSSLVHGVRLRGEIKVALIELLDARGKIFASWTLIAGRDTADWAAGRADVIARPWFVSPPAWGHRLAADGSFFEQRFRATRTLDTPRTPSLIRIRRHPEAGDEVWVRVERIELRPGL